MAQNNIDNQIKEKLNAREIQPSGQAWDRLDAMLTVAEQKKTKRFPFWFIGIAASVLVLLTAGLFLFNQEKTVAIPANEIVVTPGIQTPIINNEQQVTNNSMPTTNIGQQTTSNKQQIINTKGVSIVSQKSKQNPNINRHKEIEYLVNESIGLKDVPRIETETKVVRQNSQEVVKKPSYIDVDALLASAENSNKKQPKSNRIQVDAKSLLSYADGEVEQTFREKVINSVSKNFQEIKVALINRNQE